MSRSKLSCVNVNRGTEQNIPLGMICRNYLIKFSLVPRVFSAFKMAGREFHLGQTSEAFFVLFSPI